jgi:hypothetical protein
MQRSITPGSQLTARGSTALAPAPGSLASQAVASPLTDANGPAGEASEREADRVANAFVRGAPGRSDRGGSAAGALEPGANDGAAPESRAAAAGPAMLVDDEAETVERGQMRRAEFLAALRAEVCAAVDAGLSGTGRDSDGCPAIEYWFEFYQTKSAAQVERSVRRYAPEARGVTSARGYIPFVTARIGRSASRWARTGEITGLPADMPGPAMGGGLLGAFGGMFFKARPGGPRHQDPASVRAALGDGRSIPDPVRTRMESAFGTRFDRVRLHTDGNAASLSDRLNARAFTVGEHVAFGAGEFQPGTIAGDALIAHELAHVVQQGPSQGHSAAPGGPFHKGAIGSGQSSSAFEQDADLSAAGAVATLWGGARGRLTDIGRQAMPRMRSGLQLQRCSKTSKPAVGPKAQLSVREARDEAISKAGGLLRDVNSWASGEIKKQDKRSIAELKGPEEDPGAATQVPKVAAAIALLEKAQSLYGTKELERLPKKLDDVRTFALDARGKDPARENDIVAKKEAELAFRRAMGQAVDAASDASEMVATLSKSFDVDAVAKRVDKIVGLLNDVQGGKVDIYDAADAIKRLVKEAKEALQEMHDRFAQTPEAIGRVLFILRNFVNLNAPGKVTPPTAAEIKQFTGKLGNSGGDFSTVFAEGKATTGFSFFEGYANQLEKQLAVRAKMAEAKVDAAFPVPTQQNAEQFFKALKGKPNPQVFAAYTEYMQAFFYHRIIDSFHDMDVSGVEDFYKRPMSIAGLRPLVCTGYALLGSHLLKFAGAKLDSFIVAVRADDDDIVNDRVDAGHALAKMTLKSQTFFISNHLIVFKEDDGIGENAVAWEKSKAKLRKTSGGTIPGTNRALGNILDRIRTSLIQQREKAAGKKPAKAK